MKKYNVAIAGATGAVGETMLKILEQRNFPVDKLVLLASKRSAGKEYTFNHKSYKVEELKHTSFKNINIALFSAGASISREFVPSAVLDGTVVIDNSSAFRMEKDVPLVVPEVNPDDAFKHKGIIANPNCTTIIMVVALKPIHDHSRISRVVVSSYQSASGAGAKGMYELENQARAWAAGHEIKVEFFKHQLLYNLIPHIDVFLDNGYTKEEMKMYNETQKIMGDTSIKVTATCVRVPVFTAHSEAVTIETEKPVSPEKARELFSKAPGLQVFDDVANSKYPMPLFAAGKDDCYVGRIRKDVSCDNGLNFFISGDQLRKGAALNAVQIAELLAQKM
ncbi:MAG: aspartate-semialdehyde dehydrogenase [Spirochaetota bacterium]